MARVGAGSQVGLAVHTAAGAADATVLVAVVSPFSEIVERRTVFLGGANGRIRAALAAASILLASLRPPERAPKP